MLWRMSSKRALTSCGRGGPLMVVDFGTEANDLWRRATENEHRFLLGPTNFHDRMCFETTQRISKQVSTLPIGSVTAIHPPSNSRYYPLWLAMGRFFGLALAYS